MLTSKMSARQVKFFKAIMVGGYAGEAEWEPGFSRLFGMLLLIAGI